MTREEVDAEVTTYQSQIETKQAAAFVKLGRYAQMLGTDSEINAGLCPDEDVTPDVASLPFGLRVDEYVCSDGKAGYAIGVWVTEDGVTYNKWFSYGPEAASFNTDWMSTWNGETYGGP